MTLTEIKNNLTELSRSKKFQLVQLLIKELAQDEKELSHYLEPNKQQGFWSQYDAFEAAQKLQILLDQNT